MEQVTPTMVHAASLLIALMVGMFLSSSANNDNNKIKNDDSASRELLLPDEKKKKGTKKAKKKAAAPSPAAPSPAAPSPVASVQPIVQPSSPSEEPKKKKKKPKKKAAAPEPEPVPVPEPPASKAKKAPEVVEDDDDSDDDFDPTLLLNQKQKQKVEPKKTKKQKKEAAAKAVQEEAWVTVNKNGSSSKNGTTGSTNGETGGKKVIPLKDQDPALIIGPKGATIQQIQDASGARLDISKSAMSGSSFLEISGTDAAIATATEMVGSLITINAEEKRKAKAHSVTLEAKDIKGAEGVKAIIGKGGSTIKAIQTKTGTSIDANVDKGQVIVTGPTAEGVAEATKLCKNAVFGESQHVIELGSRVMVMVVAGRDFSKLRALQTETGARLDIDKGTTTLQLSGTMEAVNKARGTITAWMEYNKGETFHVEANKIGAVYGKAGQNILRIQDSTNTFIDVEDKGKKGKDLVECKIMGEPDAVKQAKIMFLKSANGEVELKPGEVLETLDVGPGAAALIGRGGSKIRELEATHSVKLALSSDSGVCRVTGKKSNVEAAKVAIEAIVQPLIEEQKLREEADRLAQEQGGDNQWSANAVDDADGW